MLCLRKAGVFGLAAITEPNIDCHSQTNICSFYVEIAREIFKNYFKI